MMDGMKRPQFNLKRLLLATAWFALAAYVFAEHHRFVEASRAMMEASRESGEAYGITGLSLDLCFAAVVAGVAALFGYRWIMAIVGLPTAAILALYVAGHR